MIIIKVNGGLGNQLQQYALYEKFKSLGKNVKLDLSWFQSEKQNRDLELVYFPNIQYETSTADEVRAIIGSRNLAQKAMERLGFKERKYYVEHQMYDPNIFNLEEAVLEGYFACEAYYNDIISILWDRLRFPDSSNVQNHNLKEQMDSCNSVSIHIRRGDYLSAENFNIFSGICTEEYYQSAIAYIEQHVENPHYFVFSDDPEFAKEKYKTDNYTVVDVNHGKNSFYDCYLMSQCKYNICANSTFSFWGARLNQYSQKIVIRPLKQRTNCDWYDPTIMSQLWKEWILIDEKGMVIHQ